MPQQPGAPPSSIDINRVLEDGVPQLQRLPSPLRNALVRILRRILRVDKIESFLRDTTNIRGMDLVDEIFEFIDFSFYLSARELERIPVRGRVVCVSNHPLGGLDGLLLLRAIAQVRRDVVIVANNALLAVDGLKDLFLPVQVFGGAASRDQITKIDEALKQERAVIFFPAGEVSRMSAWGIRDRRWSAGAVRMAQRHQAPILPMFVEGRNSPLFYLVSFVAKALSTVLLPGELLKPRRRNVRLHIGELIPSNALSMLHAKAATRLIRKQVESLQSGRKGPFRSEPGIARPIDRQLLRQELELCQRLGSPSPGKTLYLGDAQSAPSIIREIARLREVTFRHVGEGTGKRFDLDRYDQDYKHLFVWDEQELEIAGAYRLGFGSELLKRRGVEGFYTHSLFAFSEEMTAMLSSAVELGRSFVQRQYWNTHVLEYLWGGIGTILTQRRGTRYVFGPVSISNAYPAEARESIVYVFRKWYGARESLARSYAPFTLSAEREAELGEYFCGTSYTEDLNRLKLRLRASGLSIPMLLRQYSELCEPAGVRIADFGVDESFGSCIDGFIVLDLAYLSEAKRERFIEKYREILRYSSQERSFPTTQQLAELDSLR